MVQITNQQEVQTSQFNQPFVVPAGVGSGGIYDSQDELSMKKLASDASQLAAGKGGRPS